MQPLADKLGSRSRGWASSGGLPWSTPVPRTVLTRPTAEGEVVAACMGCRSEVAVGVPYPARGARLDDGLRVRDHAVSPAGRDLVSMTDQQRRSP
jgi:hypothetical protein